MISIHKIVVSLLAFMAIIGAPFGERVSIDHPTQPTYVHAESEQKNDIVTKELTILSNKGVHTPFSTTNFQTTEQLSQEVVGEKTPKEIHKDAQKRAKNTDGDTPVMTARDKREILWLARIVYSETKRTNEQRLVAWVVRNRVDTGYKGQTYESVATHSAQFSGLQPSDNRYEHNMSRYWASQGKSWESALRVAKEVYFAPEEDRPFAVTTRHFYSPVAVDKPNWARGQQAVRVVKSPRYQQPRFAFYSQIR